jgi:hypothetical protein
MKHMIRIGLACGVLALFSEGCSQMQTTRPEGQTSAGKKNNRFSLYASAKTFPMVVKQPPRNLIAEQGTFVEFSVKAENKGQPVTYQWQRNDGKTNSVWIDVAGATNQTFWFDHVQFEDVASYQVKVIGNEGYAMSDMTHLSVFELHHTNSTTGTLQTPILAFSTSLTVTCDGATFTRGWVPTNDFGGLGYFYGRGFSPQYSPFINPQYVLIDADTLSSGNAPANTGIQIRKNFGDGAVISCVSTHSPNSGSVTGTLTLTDAQRYRIVIYCDNVTPSSGKVTYNWLYH